MKKQLTGNLVYILLFGLLILASCVGFLNKAASEKTPGEQVRVKDNAADTTINTGCLSLILDEEFAVFFFKDSVDFFTIKKDMEDFGYSFMYGALKGFLNKFSQGIPFNLDDKGMPIAGLKSIYSDGEPLLQLHGGEKRFLSLQTYFTASGKRGTAELGMDTKAKYDFWFLGVDDEYHKKQREQKKQGN